MTRQSWYVGGATAGLGVVLAILGWRYGIRTGLDTPTHLQLAASFPDWPALWPQRIWYLSYYAVLAALGAGRGVYSGIVGLQLAFALVAAAALTDALLRRYGNWAAAVGTGLFVLAVDVQTWHWYLYSESLYTSLSLLVLLAWTDERRQPAWLAWLLPLTLIVALLRPTGLVLLAVAAWHWYQGQPPLRRRQLRYGAAAGAIGLVLLANQMLRGFLYIWFNKQGYVIYGYEEWKVVFPPDGYHPPNETPPLLALAQFYGSAPGFALELWGSRLWAQLVPLRPYFSLGHNVFLAALCVPLYALALWGTVRTWHQTSTRTWVLFIALNTAIAVVLGVDWDNRFWVPTVGPLCVLAAAGVAAAQVQRRDPHRAPTLHANEYAAGPARLVPRRTLARQLAGAADCGLPAVFAGPVLHDLGLPNAGRHPGLAGVRDHAQRTGARLRRPG